MNLQIRIVDERLKAKKIEYKSQGAAGLDIYACLDEPTFFAPGECKIVSSGMCIYIGDPNYVGLITPRSSMGMNGIILGNTMGVIDSDYQGIIKLQLWNRWTAHRVKLEPLDRVAQLLIVPVIQVKTQIVDQFNEESARGVKGFGSTGRN